MRILQIAIKNFKEIIADKRTLALVFVVPLVLLTFIYLLLSTSDIPADVGYIGSLPDIKETSDVTYHKYDSKNDLDKALKNEKIDGAVNFDTQQENFKVPEKFQQITRVNSVSQEIPDYTIYTRGTDPIRDPIYSSEILDSIDTDTETISTDTLYDNYELDDYLIIFFMEFLIFFMSFLIVGLAFLKERKNKTLQRMLTYSISRADIVFGYLLGFGFIAILQSVVIELFSIYVLGIYTTGNIILSLLVNILFSFVAISLASLISNLANSEFQVFQFIPVVIIPQLIFSDILPYGDWYHYLSAIFPMTWVFKAQSSLLLQNQLNIWKYIIILLIYVVIFSLINLLILKKTRRV